ncbi:MAG TPA: sialidase family protein [Luteimonas sp.]|nr:sialidase family protein [Luteimonas sp.]
MKTTTFAAIAACALLAGCQQVPQPETRTDAAGNTLTQWPLPAPAGVAQPDLSLAPDGRLLLSWIRPFEKDRHALQYTTFDRTGHWEWTPKMIAVGASMVVNWADTPHIAATADGTLWAHWLQKTRGEGEGHAYDVIASHSTDNGLTWSPPVRVHDDGKPVEHGFVSFWPAARDRIGVAWLDGRNTTGDAHAGHEGGEATAAGTGMTSLRAASIDTASHIADAVEVDATVCDCCGTDVAMTTRGPLLVYRDRTAEEIRDIHATRLDGDAWGAPRAVHDDGWKIAACPVNGPAVAAADDNAVVAWYSAASDVPKVQLAHSGDAGDSFADAVVVDEGEAVQGRVDVALDARQAWVAWLREDAGGQSLWLARYAPDLSRELSRTEVAKLQGRGRGTGFPKLVVRDGEAFLVWTDIANGGPQLQGVRVVPAG